MKLSYAAFAAITCTLTSLASGASRSSTVVDNTTNEYLDALVGLTVKTAAGTLVANAAVNVYVYAITDGSAYTDGVTGVDAAFTLPTVPNLKLAQVVVVNAAAASASSSPFSAALAFGGTLPQKWGIVVSNQTGLALDTVVGSASYMGVSTQ